MEAHAAGDRLKAVEEDYRNVRRRLSMPENDHLLSGERMLEIHQELCRLYPKEQYGFETPKGYTHYDFGNAFVREHLASRLAENGASGEELGLVKTIIGKLYTERLSGEKDARAKAAKTLFGLGVRGQEVFSQLQEESKGLLKAGYSFQKLVSNDNYLKDYATDLFNNPLADLFNNPLAVLLMYARLEDLVARLK